MDHWFGKKGNQPAIVFPYKVGGVVVNYKYRGFDDKSLMGQETKPLASLFNVDSILSNDAVIWCEGEPDCMAIHESGWRQIVSLKDGANKVLKAEDDPSRESDKRFEALNTHAELLASVQKFVLAGDMDEPGIALKTELARRLGRQKCWLVKWPDGCKDANATLLKHGKEVVFRAIEEAQPYPIEGVQQITGEMLDFYLELPPPPTLSTGIPSLDEIIKLPGEGRVIVITGFPNSGKSVCFMNLAVHLMEKHARKFLVFSPENEPFEEFMVQWAQVLVRKPARRVKDKSYIEVMSREERRRAGDWLRPRLLSLTSDAEDKAPTVDWIFERAKDCILRHGVTDLGIDPYNEIEATRGGMSETEFIGRFLQRARAFGARYGCNVWIIAHPAKVRPEKQGGVPGAPGPYDINASAHWYNKADIGITIHTPENVTQFILWKSRFTRWGRKGKQADMNYDENTCRYYSPSLEPESGEVINYTRQLV
jgi:twinkle protein